MFKINFFLLAGFLLMVTINGSNDSNTNTTLYSTNKTTQTQTTQTQTTQTMTTRQLVYNDYIENACVNSSFCVPILLLTGTVLFIVTLIQLCVYSIMKTSSLDENEHQEHSRNIRNPTYEHTEHTDIILIANDNYCEI